MDNKLRVDKKGLKNESQIKKIYEDWFPLDVLFYEWEWPSEVRRVFEGDKLIEQWDGLHFNL